MPNLEKILRKSYAVSKTVPLID